MAALALALAALCGRAAAQECGDAPCIWATATATYFSSTNEVTLKADYQENEAAMLYYDETGFSASVSDSLKTSIPNPSANAPATWTISNVPMGDTYSIQDSVQATLDGNYLDCEGCPGCMSCCFYGGGGGGGLCPGDPCSGCPYNGMYSEIGDSNSASTNTSSCNEGPDLDALMNEYTSAHAPRPNCIDPDDFTQAVGGSGYTLADLPYNNSTIFSQGDIEDWGIFTTDLQTMVNLMNTSTGAPADVPTEQNDSKMPLTSVYRTPVHNDSMAGTPTDEGHQHGIAFDLQTTAMHNAANDQTDADQSWTDITGWAQGLAEQQWGGTQPVCIEPSNYDPDEPDYWHVHIDMRPQDPTSPLPACTSDWKVKVPAWFP